MSRRWTNPSTPRLRETRLCGCGSPTRDGAYVCTKCLDQMTGDLRELVPTSTDPGLWNNLRSVIAGERGIDYRAVGGATGGTRSPGDDRDKIGAGDSYVETGLDLDENAVRHARALRNLLEGLVRKAHRLNLAHGAPEGWRPRSTWPTVPALAEWLSWRIDAMTWHPAFASAAVDLGNAVDAARATVMPPPYLQWLGNCPVTVGCAGSMRARRDETYATCGSCGEHVLADELRDWLIGHLINEPFTAAEIADLYDPEPAERERVRKRLNQWARRDHLVGWPRCSDWQPGTCVWPNPPRGRNATSSERAGAPLVFRFGDAFDLLVQHQDQSDDARSDT